MTQTFLLLKQLDWPECVTVKNTHGEYITWKHQPCFSMSTGIRSYSADSPSDGTKYFVFLHHQQRKTFNNSNMSRTTHIYVLNKIHSCFNNENTSCRHQTLFIKILTNTGRWGWSEQQEVTLLECVITQSLPVCLWWRLWIVLLAETVHWSGR